METPNADAACAALAATQHGVIGHQQAIDAGLSKFAINRRASTGSWIRVLPGVYRLAGVPVTWHQRLMAACLWGGPGAVASHRSAAALWDLRGGDQGAVEISSCKRARASLDVKVHRVETPAEETTVIRGIPVTGVGRTLLDLAAAAPESLGEAVDAALRRGLIRLSRLRWLAGIHRSRGRKGSAALRRALEERSAVIAHSESAVEAQLARLLSKARLPSPVPQFEVWEGKELVGRIDFAYPGVKLAIEVDGYAYHSSRRAFQRDRDRQNRLIGMGWRVLRVTAEDLRLGPREVIASAVNSIAWDAGKRPSGVESMEQ